MSMLTAFYGNVGDRGPAVAVFGALSGSGLLWIIISAKCVTGGLPWEWRRIEMACLGAAWVAISGSTCTINQPLRQLHTFIDGKFQRWLGVSVATLLTPSHIKDMEHSDPVHAMCVTYQGVLLVFVGYLAFTFICIKTELRQRRLYLQRCQANPQLISSLVSYPGVNFTDFLIEHVPVVMVLGSLAVGNLRYQG